MNHFLVILRTSEGLQECCLFSWRYVPMTFNSKVPYSGVWLDVNNDLPDFWRLEQQTASDDALILSSHSGKSSSSKRFVPKPHRRLGDIVFLKDLSLWKRDKMLPQAEVPGHMNNALNTDTTSSDIASPSTDNVAEIISHQKDNPESNTCLDAISSDSILDTPIPKTSSSLSKCMVIVPQKVCTVFLNAHAASALWKCVISSQVFRKCLLQNLRRKFQRSASSHPGSSESNVQVTVSFVLDIVSVWPVQRMDYVWGWRMNHILTKRVLLEEAMAWLSTLGGAHSSLGEYFLHHAEQAGRVSLKQLKLALDLGDPLTVGRCHMFWAYSLMQRGHWRHSKVIVRQVYKLASTHCVTDTRLINMCNSAWMRIQHLHKVDWRKKRAQGGNIKTSGEPVCRSTESQPAV